MVGISNAVDAGTQGVKYVNTTGQWSGLDGGASGLVLTSNGTGVAPSFQASSGFGSPTAFTAGTAGAANQTGAGNFAPIVCGIVLGNLGGAFDGVSTFTAPATGWYSFSSGIVANNLTALMTSGRIILNTTTFNLESNYINSSARQVSNQLGLFISATVPMSIGQTAFITYQFVGGAGNTAGYSGGGLTFFSGFRVA